LIFLVDGKRIQRKFLKTEKLQIVFDWVFLESNQTVNLNHSHKFRLMSTLPKKEYTDPSKTLEELGLSPSATLVIYDIK
jgi:hypothetical protein